ncbi:MAG: DUF4350 domain-containing protein [Planctomycetaceae bacterium]
MPDRLFHLRRAALLMVAAALAATPQSLSRAEAESHNGTNGRAVIPDDVRIEEATVGIEGRYEVGRWTPVAVQVRVDRPQRVRLVVEATDPEGSVAAFPSDIVALDGAGSHVLRGLFLQGRLHQGRTWIGIEDEAGRRLFRGELGRDVRARMLAPLVPGTRMIATLGDPAGFDAPRERGPDASEARILVALEDPAALPIDFPGWEALDVVVLSGRFDLGPERDAALREWVRGGGHLVVAVGANVPAYRRSALAEWAPVSVADEPVRLRELSGLETFADALARLTTPAGIATARIVEHEGTAVVRGTQGPLLVRAAHGFGQVTFLAIDLADPAVAQWQALPTLIRKLLGEPTSADGTSPTTRRGGRLGHSGIGDLATQLRASQEAFPAVDRFSLWGVMGLLLLYLLVIGPADYLLVNHVLKRPRATWLTFPLIVLGAAFVAVWGAAATNGDTLRTNRLDMLDLDVATGTIRGRSWTTILSPRTQRYEVESPALKFGVANQATRTLEASGSLPGNAVSPRLGWSGIPEAVAGGMYRTGGFEMVRPAYRFAPEARRVENLPIATWSTRTLAARWQEDGPALVESNLRDAGLGDLEGALTHHLPGPIEHWLIAFGNRVYHSGSNSGDGGANALAPGAVWRPQGTDVASRELRGFLTATVAVRVEGRDSVSTRQSPYDPLERDPLAILRMLTFHAAAGGSDYTGLENQLLNDLELTDALDAGRAVLFGRLRVPAPPTRIGGKPVADETQTVVVRIVLPVAPRDPSVAAAVAPPEIRSTAFAKARP